MTEHKRPKNVSISSEKSLVQYTADSPRTYHTLLRDLFDSKIVVFTKLSDVLKKVTNIALIMGIVLIIAIVVGQMPVIIDTIAKYTGTERKVITETRVLYLTEEQARAQGIDVPEDPNTLPPEPTATIECSPGLTLTVTPEHPEGECVANPPPPPKPEPEPKKEGFDIVNNLLPQVQTGGFLPPARTGSGQTQDIDDLLENGTATITENGTVNIPPSNGTR